MSKNDIAQYIDAHKQEMLDMLEKLVNLEGYLSEKEHLTKTATFIKEAFEETCMECWLADAGEDVAPYVCGVLGKERKGKPFVFTGHFDTVFKKGTYGENPFRRDKEKVYGPGVVDMRGGIIVALYAIKALNAVGYDARPIKICFVSDEEGKHPRTLRPIHIMEEMIEGAVCGFNMETGIPEGALCVGRSAVVNGNIKVIGKASHAGAAYSNGINAIVEMSHKIVELVKLTNLERGTTVSCDVISGGTVVNAVPDKCTLNVDMRFATNDEMVNTIKRAEEICKQEFVSGAITEFEFEVVMPPFETTPEVMRFFDYVKQISDENSYGITKSAFLGGGSDASRYGKHNVPVLCSCGVAGLYNHTPHEFAYIASLYERAELAAMVIENLDRFEV